ncbi:hypothetical protein Hanom_Chr16g01439931 [Helianthus anomalus]
MDGINELDENGKISNLLNPDTEKQTFERKSQNWPNLKDGNGILLKYKTYSYLIEVYLKKTCGASIFNCWTTAENFP